MFLPIYGLEIRFTGEINLPAKTSIADMASKEMG